LKKFNPGNRDREKITPHKTIRAVSGKSDFLKKFQKEEPGLRFRGRDFFADRLAQAQP